MTANTNSTMRNKKAALPIVLAASIIAIALGASHAGDAYAALEFSTKFGSQGSADGDLDGPADVYLDRNKLYVVERDNHRVSVFYIGSSGHDFSEKFGSEGRGDNNFKGPLSIEKGDRHFVVADAGNKRVKIVDKDGNHVRMIGSTTSSNEGPINTPSAVATDGGGRRILVLDSADNKLLIFKDTGTLEDSVTKIDADKLSNPGAITVSSAVSSAVYSDIRYVYVADTGSNRIAEFMLLGHKNHLCPVPTQGRDGICFTRLIGGLGSGDAKFQDPTGLAVHVISNDVRDLYVADTGNNRIQVLRLTSIDVPPQSCPSGSKNITKGICFVEEFGSKGTGDGKFDGPRGMTIDTSKKLLYVADTENDRIQVLKLDSKPLTSGSSDTGTTSGSSSSSPSTSSATKPGVPRSVQAVPTSSSSILVKWSEPLDLGPGIIGYKVEYRLQSPGESESDYQTVVSKTRTNATSLHHTNLDHNTKYTYRISAIGPAGNDGATSGHSSAVSARPANTDKPVIVDFVAMTPKQVKIAWLSPSNTFGSVINNFVVGEQAPWDEKEFSTIDNDIGRSQTVFLHKVNTGEDITLAVKAQFGNGGSSPYSEPATTVARSNSYHSGHIEPEVAEFKRLDPPTPPIKVLATPVTERSIEVSWVRPADDGNLPISGYAVEAKKSGSSRFVEIADSLSGTKYLHSGIERGSTYTYRVYAANSQGTSDASNESTATARSVGITVNSIGTKSATEGQTLTFTASVSGDVTGDTIFKLNGAPSGASISRDSGVFTWTPTPGQGGDSYVFEVEATRGSYTDGETVRIRVNEGQAAPPTPAEPSGDTLPSFVDENEDPQTYVDRYNTDAAFKEWFDTHHLERYGSIYDAVGVLQVPAAFVDGDSDPQVYVDRYLNEAPFTEWFDENYSQYDSIYHAVGLEDPDSKTVDDAPLAPDGETAELQYGLPRLDVPLAPFVDESEDPMTYVHRYENNTSFKEWFDQYYAEEYSTIYRAVGLLDVPAAFVDESEDPMTYVYRYENEEPFAEWFDENYSQYLSIYHAVGLPEPEVQVPQKQYGICGPDTKLIEGICTVI